jgi:hypothetical protein
MGLSLAWLKHFRYFPGLEDSSQELTINKSYESEGIL